MNENNENIGNYADGWLVYKKKSNFKGWVEEESILVIIGLCTWLPF